MSIVSGPGTGQTDDGPWFYFVRYGGSIRGYPANWKGTVFLVGMILLMIAGPFAGAGLWLLTKNIAWFIGAFAVFFPIGFITLFWVMRARGRELPVPAMPMGFGRAGLRAYVQQMSAGGAAPFAGVYNAVGNPALVVQAIDHVQMAIPPGGEEQARPFYRDLLQMAEQPKPPELAARGGAWFSNGAVKVHLGVEDPFNPAEKAHPAFLVNDVSSLAQHARAAGYKVKDDDALAGHQRIYIYDPFGNRLEFLRPN